MSVLDRVHWIDLPSHGDERGVLTVIEGEQDIPIPIKRIFYVHHVTEDRGGHAHRDTVEVIIAVYGTFQVILSDGDHSHTYDLIDPTRGLYVPPMTFIEMRNFSPGAVCLVVTDTHYDMSKSLRNWEDYLGVVKA
jgi:dTDP-4-dehydrorhamnose 3,5-epimerase-like enzyme